MELIGGREHRRIVVVDYDEQWTRTFEDHRARIRSALGGALGSVVRVEHVGSTAVPALAAKPIVDVQVSVEDVEDEPSYVPALTAAGYVIRVRETGHRMLRTAALEAHVHVCSTGSEWERRHLLFRDWLRVSPADRSAYEALKRSLAERDWETMNDYADAKHEFIAEVLDRAEVWAERTG